MALILREIYKNYDYYVYECRDTRVEGYFLTGHPIQIVSIMLCYFYFVKYLGPSLMEKRKPFELTAIMAVYNVVQILLNTILGGLGIYYIMLDNFNFTCNVIDYGDSLQGRIESNLTYCYYLLKLLDLLDTVFFVLRKKYNQITFLHVYHHIAIASGGYVGARYLPGGHGYLLGQINCFVHSFMYFYYFLTSVRPDLKASIWWKKHITHIQMLQFLILVVYFGQPLVRGNCPYPKIIIFIAFVQNAFMLVLFGDFYYKAYLRKSKKID